MSYGIVLFKATGTALKTEKMLTGEGYTVSIVPTPREFAGGCGIAIRFSWSQGESIKAELEKAGVDIQGIHEIQS